MKQSGIEPPNGQRVTQAQLYEALYKLDQAMSSSFTTVHDAINDLRDDLSRHSSDGHPYTQAAEVVKEELKLDAKKAGIVTGILAVVAALGALASKALDLLVS